MEENRNRRKQNRLKCQPDVSWMIGVRGEAGSSELCRDIIPSKMVYDRKIIIHVSTVGRSRKCLNFVLTRVLGSAI